MTVSAQGIPVNTLICRLLLGEYFGWCYSPNSFSGSKNILCFNLKNISGYLPHATYFIRCWIVWVFKRHFPLFLMALQTMKKNQLNVVSIRPFFLNSSSSHHPVWLLFLGSAGLSDHSSFVPIAGSSLSISYKVMCSNTLYFVLFSHYSTYSPRVTSCTLSWWLM